MQDLNDLSLFAQVVRHGSFSAASRATGVPKSRLSRRIAQLERDLGVQLLRRTTRQVRVTPIGEAFYERCQAMLAEAEAAHELVEQSRSLPGGTLRMSCPVGVAQSLLAPVIGHFLQGNPGVKIELEATNRRVDPIAEGFDLALRVREVLEDSSLAARTFGESPLMLVASPALLDSIGRPCTPDALQGIPAVCQKPYDGKYVWLLSCGASEATQIAYEPRLVTDEFALLLAAATAGVGVAMLPQMYCRDAIEKGELEVLLPHCRMPIATIHAVFPSRTGMSSALRRFLDFLTEIMPETARSAGVPHIGQFAMHRPPGSL